MHFPSGSILTTPLLFISFVQIAYSQYNCPPLGPVLPAPQHPSTNANVKAIVKKASAAFKQIASTFNETAVSIGVQSVFEDAPLASWHYTPKFLNQSGTSAVTLDTVYRIASVSKLYTVLAVLQLNDKIEMSAPITQYVPQLAQLQMAQAQVNNVTTVNWTEITVDALASHLAGLAPQLGIGDLAATGQPLTALGIPAEGYNTTAMCGSNPLAQPCSVTDFYQKFGLVHPVYAPYTTSVYSDIAIAVLGLLIETVTGQNYADYMQANIFSPLNLSSTSVLAPSNSKQGFISVDPPAANWWGVSLGAGDSSGGFYASTRDLLNFGRAILSFNALSEFQTRAWLKPRSHTSSLGYSVGAPWEILRANSVTSDRRVIDFYTKTGNLGAYNTFLALVPDYQIVIVVALAGGAASTNAALSLIESQVVSTIMPAIEVAGKAEATENFAGLYQSSTSGVNARLELSIDSGPGLVVTNWTRDGRDLLAEAPLFDPLLSPGQGLEVRLYPTSLRTTDDVQTQSAWRAIFSSLTSETAAQKENEALFFVDGSCQTWSEIGLITYGLVGIDDFVFTIDAGGKAVSVNDRALRTVLARVGM